MAVTVTPNLTTFSLADDNTGGTWVGASGAFDNQVNLQGTNCWFYQTPKNGNGDGNFAPTSSVDMSAADTHIYWWMRCDVMPFCEDLNTGATSSGLMVKVESSASDYVTWHIAGANTWGGEWKAFVIDVNNTANTFSVTGTLDLSAVTKVSFLTDNSNSGNIRIVDNTMLDAVRFGTGLTVTGTLFDWTDVATEDELPANKWGILEIIDENVHCQGRLIVGDGATTTTLESTDEEIVFKDVIVSDTLYEITLVGTGNISTFIGFSAKSAGASRYKFDASSTDIGFKLTGSNLKRADEVLFGNDSTIIVTGDVFNDCLQIRPRLVTFTDNIIKNFSSVTGSVGAVLFPANDVNFARLTFEGCEVDIEYDGTSDSTSPRLEDIIHTAGGTKDINNTSGSSVDLALIGSSDGSTYTGSVVNFLTTVTLTIHVTNVAGGDIKDVYAYIDDPGDTAPFIMNTQTDGFGIATVDWTGGTISGAWWRARLYGYRPFTAKIDVPASGELTVPVTLIVDPQQT